MFRFFESLAINKSVEDFIVLCVLLKKDEI